ncbi:MAG: tol-pal system-associated acyl-CoA thioesterase [Candidatus Methylumidiphilus sp.]
MKTPFLWPVRVYYEDTDAGGVVYHGNYLKFFERARTERLRAMGFEQDALRQEFGILFAVRSAQVDYLKSARFNDALLVSAEVVDLRRASMSFAQDIRRGGADGELLCRASFRIACLTDTGLRPTPIPDILLETIGHGR